MPDNRPSPSLLPPSLIALLTAAVAIFLIEKLLIFARAFSGLILMLALAWLLAFTLQPLIVWLQNPRLPERLRQRLGDRHPIVRIAGAMRLPKRFSMQPKNQEPAAAGSLPFGLAVTLVYGLLLAGLALAALALLPVLMQQLRQLAQTMQTQAGNLPSWVQSANVWLNDARSFLADRLDLDPNMIVLPQPGALLNQAPAFGANLLQFGLGLAGSIAAALSQFLLIIFLSLFITLDNGAISNRISSVLPERYKDEYEYATETIDGTFGGFLRGTVLQSLIFGLGVSVLMFLLRIESALIIGVAAGLVVLVPIVGGIVATVLPVLVAILQGSPNAIWLLLALLIFQVILYNMVMPAIFSRALKMPSLLVIVSLLIGSQVMGFWGFVFGVPLAAVIYAIVLMLLERVKDRQNALDGVAVANATSVPPAETGA